MGDNADLAACLDAIATARLLVVGDVMLDRFVYGTVERISPEGPIPVLRVERDEAMLGGAGNVLRNLAALGVRATFLSVVGDDEAGDEVRALVADQVGDGARLLTDAGRATTIKQRYIAGGQQLLRTDRETVGRLREVTEKALLEEALQAVGEADVVLLSDYGKGVLQPGIVAAVIGAARAAGATVVVDPKGRDYSVYRGADVVTPNRRELQDATGCPVGDEAEIVAACRKMMAESGVAAVLATRSAQGMTLVSDADEAHHFPAEAREVYDVSGAGDTVVAVLGAALGAGVALADAARLANVAAGIVVGKVGTAVAHPGELLRALHRSDLMAAEAKIVDLDSLTERLAQWRRAGFEIGFTNGCFDLLHPGHVSLLHQARAACDRLVVGLNSDASVRRLKGDSRPVQNEVARAAVLASLATVDQVIIFGEDTPLRLIEAIRPDVLVKGADYSVEQVVGGDIVRGYGGRILLAELAPGHSTSGTIEKLTG